MCAGGARGAFDVGDGTARHARTRARDHRPQPTTINVIMTYAFCNLHDVSWGNREAAGVAKSLTGEAVRGVRVRRGRTRARVRKRSACMHACVRAWIFLVCERVSA